MNDSAMQATLGETVAYVDFAVKVWPFDPRYRAFQYWMHKLLEDRR